MNSVAKPIQKNNQGKLPLNNYAINLSNVFAGYGKTTILFDISLKVKQGNVIAVIGNSGAGKSTGIRCMTAQITPTKGTAFTAGVNVKNRETVQALIGYVPQLEYLSLYYKFSAEQNALFFGRNFGISKKEIKKRCRELMGILGLGAKEFIKKPVKKLSGGEKKRVSIMIGLINQPKILFLDEPTTGLDPHLRIEVLNFLQRINQKYNTTMLLVSHDLECVEYCDKVVSFADGCMVDFGSPRDMIKSLPNKGRALQVKFSDISPEQDTKIRQIKKIKYLILVGRNQYKFFFKSKKDVSDILKSLKAIGLTPIKAYYVSSTFLEYFRIQSEHFYDKKAKEIKEKLKKGI